VDVKNVGPGVSGDKTYVAVKNLGDEKVFIKKGRVVLGALKPGEVKSAVLQLDIRRGLRADKVPLRLMVVDEKLDEYVAERLELPVAPDGKGSQPASGAARVTAAEQLLRTGASDAALPIALARRGAVLPVNGRAGGYLRVEWQKGRSAFVAASAVELSRSGKPAGGAVEVWQREPPRIAFVPDPSRGAPSVTADRIHVQGTASVPEGPGEVATRLRDVFIFANDQKVFFKVVPGTSGATRVEFAADVPLKPGNNAITVFAREDEDFQSRRTVFVNRRGATPVAQQGAAK